MAKPKNNFSPPTSAENQFARSLRKVARHSSHIVEAHFDGKKIHNEAELQQALKDYSKLIDPWARRQSFKMLEKVSRSNKTAWTKNSKLMGTLLKEGVAQQRVGAVAARLMAEQVALIQSIPLDLATRTQKLSTQAVYEGKRADEVAQMLKDSGKVSESKADLIARTEVARATASINESRAVAVGSRQYRWRNSGDESVREAHRKYKGHAIEGMIFEWDNPPVLDDGTKGHPGTFPNCRCYAEPIF